MATKKDTKGIDRVWLVTREYEGLAGAGGVKDVSRQLATALARSGRKVSVVLPFYGLMDHGELGFAPLGLSFEVDMPYVGLERRETVSIWQRRLQGVAVYLVEAARFREKQGIYTYTAAEEAKNPLHVQGTGHYDYFAMNVLLQKAALALMVLVNERPDIIHCQDGHTAILPAMIREQEGYRHYFRRTGAVVTIHNAGKGYHQEVDDLPFAQTICDLPARVIHSNLLDNSFDPLLAASSYAVLNTVSENYARELRETDDDALTGWLGHRLRTRNVRLEGVTNGIDPADYNPGQPKKMGLAAGFSPLDGELAGKRRCREELVQRLAAKGLKGVQQDGRLDDRPELPLFTLIGRFTAQKGVDKLADALEILLPLDPDFQVLIMGSGTRDIEDRLSDLARRKVNRGRVCVLRGFDLKLANQVYASGDFFVIPSLYEPCGLTDFIAQLFGSLPVVHHVGGLVKVEEGVTGFAYQEHSSAALMGAMQKALRVFREEPERIRQMQQAAVGRIFERYTWDTVAERYITLYRTALTLTP